MPSKFSIGVDIGGSHITSIAINTETRSFINESIARNAVDCHAAADVILNTWASTLRQTLTHINSTKLQGIGFAMPGPFDYPAGIARFEGVQKYDFLNGINVRDELAQRLGIKHPNTLRFMNDATCFAIGEAWMGEASAYKRVMAITLGTGFGSSFLANGIPVESGSEVPPMGCVYHLPYNESIADDHFSTRWFLSKYKTATGIELEGVKELAERYESEPLVQAIFGAFGGALGLFLAPWLKRFKAECLVIGGNISKSYPLFEDSFKKSFKIEALDHLKVYISEMGENAALSGSARLSDDAFYAKLDTSAIK
jgi:glucokinase